MLAINRKMLAEFAVNEPEVFKEIVNIAKAALPKEGEAPNLEELKKKHGVAPKPKAKMPESPFVEKVENGEKKKK